MINCRSSCSHLNLSMIFCYISLSNNSSPRLPFVFHLTDQRRVIKKKLNLRVKGKFQEKLDILSNSYLQIYLALRAEKLTPNFPWFN